MLQQAVKLRHTHLYAPVIAVFAQISQKKALADSEALNKVITLLKNLQSKLRESKNLYENAEAKDKADYEAEIIKLDLEIAALETEIARLDKEIAGLEQKVIS